MARRKQESSGSGLMWGLLAVAGLGVAGGVAYAMSSGGGSASPAERGYEVLDGCGGVKVLDDAKAMAFAEAAGARSSNLAGDPAAWIGEAANALGSTSLCGIDSYPIESLGFVVRLLVAYLRGAAKAGRVPQLAADTIISKLKAIALAKGVPEKDLA